MRVIKFRGKRLDDNKWIYGDLLTMDGRAFIASMYQWDSCEDPRDFVSMLEVHPETVGQFTGRVAKRTDVYGGDIVEARLSFESGTLPIMGTVEYDDDLASFGLRNEGGFTPIMHLCLNTLEVVGSIHEPTEAV